VSTVTKTRPPSKTSVVSCEPFAVEADNEVGVLLSTLSGKKGLVAFYRCRRIECADLAFQLDKLSFETGSDPEERGYVVALSASTCECKGYLKWGTCKHLTSLRLLYEKGQLP
jgi:hypothetical protein